MHGENRTQVTHRFSIALQPEDTAGSDHTGRRKNKSLVNEVKQRKKMFGKNNTRVRHGNEGANDFDLRPSSNRIPCAEWSVNFKFAGSVQ